jgi:hypothetical protein
MSKLMVLLIMVVMTMMLLATGCSAAGPGAAQITKDVTETFDKTVVGGKPSTNPRTRVTSVKKVNGRKGPSGTYEVEVAYQIKFLMSLEECQEGINRALGPNDPASLVFKEAMGKNFGTWQKGETKEYVRWVAYQKTEKGWKPLAFVE